MSNRVTKPRVAKSKKTVDRDSLLSAILQNAVSMPSCSFCEGRGISSCQVSLQDSSRCAECVRLGRSRCDVQGVGPAELRNIAEQHQKLEDELLAAEEKVLRLRKQKKMWYEKMMRAVRRGIDNVEELDRVEGEEAEAERKRIAEQSAEAARRNSSEEAGGMVAQENWLRAEGDVGVYDWSSLVNDGVDWSAVLESGVDLTGSENLPVGGPSGGS